MATKKAKPNGQFYLIPECVENYFHDIPINDLPGVGYSTTQKLNHLNWKTCFDLQQIQLARLQQEFGKKFGETLHQYCRGIDNKPLVFDQVRKSVSAEVNYGIRFKTEDEFDTFLQQLCHEVHNRLVELKAKGKTITLKLMVRASDAPVETAKFMGHGFCDNVTKSTTLASFTNELDVIVRTVFAIKNSLDISPSELRGIGIQISKLDGGASNRPQAKTNSLKSLFEKAKEKTKFTRIPSVGSLEQPSSTTLAEDTKAFTNSDYAYSQIDVNVLAELPEDIREEVLREQESRNRQLSSPTKSKAFEINFNRSADVKQDIKRHVSAMTGCEAKAPVVRRITPVSDGNILIQSNWRDLLNTWLDSTDQPADCDIELITNFLKELLGAQMLDEIYLRLRFIHR